MNKQQLAFDIIISSESDQDCLDNLVGFEKVYLDTNKEKILGFVLENEYVLALKHIMTIYKMDWNYILSEYLKKDNLNIVKFIYDIIKLDIVIDDRYIKLLYDGFYTTIKRENIEIIDYLVAKIYEYYENYHNNYCRCNNANDGGDKYNKYSIVHFKVMNYIVELYRLHLHVMLTLIVNKGNIQLIENIVKYENKFITLFKIAIYYYRGSNPSYSKIFDHNLHNYLKEVLEGELNNIIDNLCKLIKELNWTIIKSLLPLYKQRWYQYTRLSICGKDNIVYKDYFHYLIRIARLAFHHHQHDIFNIAIGGYYNNMKNLNDKYILYIPHLTKISGKDDIFENNNEALRNYARDGDIKCIEFLIEQGADVNDFDGDSLYQAVVWNQLAAIELLIKSGANVNINNGKALSVASENNQKDIVELLIKSGADVNINNGKALAVAAKNGNLKLVRYLIESGAKCEIGNEGLLEVISNGHVNIIKFLMLHDLVVSDSIKSECLLLALDKCPKLAEFFRQLGYQVNVNGEELCKAIDNENIEGVRYLLDNGVDIHFNDDEPLRRATKIGNIDIIVLLLKAGADRYQNDSEAMKKLVDDENYDALEDIINHLDSK